nr:MAG TPA: hypothetical protein [Caudoviricetes sp.]
MRGCYDEPKQSQGHSVGDGRPQIPAGQPA